MNRTCFRSPRQSLACGNLTLFTVVAVAAAANSVGASSCFGFADDKTPGADSIAKMVKPGLPAGWTISVQDNRVRIARERAVDFYNSIALPADSGKEIKRRTRHEQLVIWLRPGARISQAEHRAFAKNNQAAIAKARLDANHGKLNLDARFWRTHPEFGYRELPSLYDDSYSVYLKSEPAEYLVFVGRQIGGNYLWKFSHADVEKECQGVVDDFGKLWHSYDRATDLPGRNEPFP